MDCSTGKIYSRETEEDIRKEFERLGRKPLLLDENQFKELKPLSLRKRKNKMRNQSCVCGSGKKFKKCCWSEYV